MKGYIYFMTNSFGNVLYIGVTNSLKLRINEHIDGAGAAFTHKYNCTKLVYYECFADIEQAIAREKQLKHFKREWKDKLVESLNPEWRDLSGEIIVDPDIL
jgi:putative endonuclease